MIVPSPSSVTVIWFDVPATQVASVVEVATPVLVSARSRDGVAEVSAKAPVVVALVDVERVSKLSAMVRRFTASSKETPVAPPNAPPLLYCTKPSAPAGVPPLVMQAPEGISKQPPASRMPFANVEEAVPVWLMAKRFTPPVKVEVALPSGTVVRPVVSILKIGVAAVPVAIVYAHAWLLTMVEGAEVAYATVRLAAELEASVRVRASRYTDVEDAYRLFRTQRLSEVEAVSEGSPKVVAKVQS